MVARVGRKLGTLNKVTTLIKETATALSALAKVGKPAKAYDKDGKFISIFQLLQKSSCGPQLFVRPRCWARLHVHYEIVRSQQRLSH